VPQVNKGVASGSEYGQEQVQSIGL
jgi:hypothetical protein